jgi:hypothetical protein
MQLLQVYAGNVGMAQEVLQAARDALKVSQAWVGGRNRVEGTGGMQLLEVYAGNVGMAPEVLQAARDALKVGEGKTRVLAGFKG